MAHANNYLQASAGGTQRKCQQNPLPYILALSKQLMTDGPPQAPNAPSYRFGPLPNPGLRFNQPLGGR
eukprot:714491-Alexandrium_andersonii.AAC.1